MDQPASNVTTFMVDVFSVDYPNNTFGIIFMGMSILITTWIIINNVLLLYVLFKYQELHTDTNIIIGSLCAADLGMSSTHFLLLVYYINSPWTTHTAYVMCLSTVVIMLFFNSASVNIFLCALIERYLKICRPFFYQRIMSRRIAVTMVMIAIATASVVSMPLLYKDHWHPAASCGFSHLVNPTVRRMFLTYCVLAFVSVSFFTIRLFVTIRHQQKSVAAIDHFELAKKASIDRAKALVTMMLFLFLTYSPYVMVLATMATTNGDFVKAEWFVYLEKLTMKLCLLNNIGNPVMYGWRDRQIKKYVKKTLCFCNKTESTSDNNGRHVTIVTHI